MNPMLTDRFGRFHRYLRISVTDRCNLRCVYCMPAEGLVWKPRQEILTYEEIVRLARIFVDLGVDKIRLTGGEPTIRTDIELLMERLAQLKGLRHLLLTTNGVTLRKKANLYREKGLTGINISLDTLNPDRFLRITRRDNFYDVLAGIDAALEAGFESVKLNIVVMAGVNDGELLDFVDTYRDTRINVRFIEFMPFRNNGWNQAGLVSYAQMKARIQEHYELIPMVTEPSAVAKDFAVAGYPVTVSFITSMTQSFCSTCSRIRLTADGSIKACLFHPAEVNVRNLLRQGVSDTILVSKIHEALMRKPEGHAAPLELQKSENRSMIEIGG